jgi:cyclopropane fatty-acyl-phospholipid synthase-like methyltransferase
MPFCTGLDRKVNHLCGDFKQVSKFLAPASFNAVVSWLTVLHFEDRMALFKQCYTLLQPGGTFYAADFFARNPLPVLEKQILRDEVYCYNLPSLAQYKEELEAAGFEIVVADDCTTEWTGITAQRVKDWEAKREEMIAIAGESVYSDTGHFYSVVADLYSKGNLGGVSIVARKPLGW